MIVWSRLYFDLEPYLSERSTGGTTLLTFYHRQLGEAAAALFLETTDDQQRAHAHLADYFHRQEYFLESLEAQRQRALSPPPTPRPANQRASQKPDHPAS